MIQKVYKVFKVLTNHYEDDDDDLYSERGLYSANSIYRQKYRFNQINKPFIPNSKIFCFKTIRDARDFINDEMAVEYGLEIYECLADNVVDSPNRIPRVRNDLKYLEASWLYFNEWENSCINYYSETEIEITTRDVPPGSFLCDSLYILRKIKDDERDKDE